MSENPYQPPSAPGEITYETQKPHYVFGYSTAIVLGIAVGVVTTFALMRLDIYNPVPAIVQTTLACVVATVTLMSTLRGTTWSRGALAMSGLCVGTVVSLIYIPVCSFSGAAVLSVVQPGGSSAVVNFIFGGWSILLAAMVFLAVAAVIRWTYSTKRPINLSDESDAP